MAMLELPRPAKLTFLCALTLVWLSMTVTEGYRGMVGGKTEVKDVASNVQVQELGRYSVEEYNRRTREAGGGELKFSQVLEAQTQVVNGIKYYLRIEVVKGEEKKEIKVFDSVVVVKPWAHSKQLLNFAPSNIILRF